jgi:integration host factor subunit beta
MNKSDLIEKIVSKTDMPRKRAESVVNLIFDAMTAALAEGERIEIRGFGSFVAKHYRSRTGRNPRTGQTIPVPAKRLPFFKVGKELRERVDAGAGLSKSVDGANGRVDGA